MRQKTVSQEEIQINFLHVLSQMERDQEFVVLDGQIPVARITPISAPIPSASPTSPMSPESSWDQIRVRFAEFEFPFP